MKEDNDNEAGPGLEHSLRAFRNRAYRQLWSGLIVNGFANWITRLTVGWFVFDQTGWFFHCAVVCPSEPSSMLMPKTRAR